MTVFTRDGDHVLTGVPKCSHGASANGIPCQRAMRSGAHSSPQSERGSV